MSTYIDDFNRAAFERALPKFNRCQYDAMTIDDWVALVEGYRDETEGLLSEVETLKEQVAELEEGHG